MTNPVGDLAQLARGSLTYQTEWKLTEDMSVMWNGKLTRKWWCVRHQPKDRKLSCHQECPQKWQCKANFSWCQFNCPLYKKEENYDSTKRWTKMTLWDIHHLFMHSLDRGCLPPPLFLQKVTTIDMTPPSEQGSLWKTRRVLLSIMVELDECANIYNSK